MRSVREHSCQFDVERFAPGSGQRRRDVLPVRCEDGRPEARHANGERRDALRNRDPHRRRASRLHPQGSAAQRIPARVGPAGGLGAGTSLRHTPRRRPWRATGPLPRPRRRPPAGGLGRDRVRHPQGGRGVPHIRARPAQDRERDRRRYRRVPARVRAETGGRRVRSMRRAANLVPALALMVSGCTYYNAMWSAERFAKDARLRERAGLAAAQCALATGKPSDAEHVLTEALASSDPRRRSRAEYLAGQGAAGRLDYDSALAHFRRSQEPAALPARARVLLAAARPVEAAAVLDTLTGIRFREAEWTELLDGIAIAGGDE